MEYLRVCSWNINGLRSLKPSLKDLWDSLNSDIICLQETKASREFGFNILFTDNLSSKYVDFKGYNCYFANSIYKPGYSGTYIND